jgi:hypothetical protein
MSLAMIGSKSAFEFRWRRWALLRDTVMFLEPTAGRFPHFYSIGDALNDGSLRIPAGPLGEDIGMIQRLLRGHTLEDLAISPATAAVLYMGARESATRPLTPRERTQIAPAGAATDLTDYFGSMCDAILDVCSKPLPDGRVEILDG